MNLPAALPQRPTPPDVSVCLINHHALDFTLQCIRSIFKCTPQSSLEVIVVDNASHDECALAIGAEFPEVLVIENIVPSSFPVNCNLAIRHSTGRYVLVLNNDTLIRENAIDLLMHFMEHHPECGLCSAKLLRPDGSAQYVFIQLPSLRSYAYRTLVLQNLSAVSLAWRKRISKVSDYRTIIEVDNINGACMLVRRNVIEQVGLFDENFNFYYEDVDWCLRIGQAGWKMYIVPQAQIVHWGDASLSQIRARAKIEEYKSAQRFFGKHRLNPLAAKPVLKIIWLINGVLGLSGYSVLALLGRPDAKRYAHDYLVILAWHLIPWRRRSWESSSMG